MPATAAKTSKVRRYSPHDYVSRRSHMAVDSLRGTPASQCDPLEDSEEVFWIFVVLGGDPLEPLDPVEEVLDQIASALDVAEKARAPLRLDLNGMLAQVFLFSAKARMALLS